MTKLHLTIMLICSLMVAGSVRLAQSDDRLTSGKEIYAKQCASCHGAAGEGNSEHFPNPLQGDLSLGELTKLVAETMPESHPETCVGEQAEQVSRFVFDSFYSQQAQLRARNVRIELSRLTVRQYRESVADLIGSFGNPVWIPGERGLQANYFAARNWTESRRLAKQVDATIDFADGVEHFDPTGEYAALNIKKKKGENKMNDGFSVYWTGGLIAPKTGQYHFVVESKNGFDLRINDLDRSLIDRKVRSDDVVEHRATAELLGGRMYSFRLDLFSYPDPPAKIRVLWEPPGQPLSVIPESAFTPHHSTEIAVVSTPFPADDASRGYERGVAVSSQWDAATTESAIEAATWVADRIWKLAKSKPEDDDAIEKVKSFCHQFVSRALVKELDGQERQFFVNQHFDAELSIRDQVKRVVIMTLKSPRFLYPALQVRDQGHEAARRLALVLWDSMPDKQIYDLATSGQLADPEKRTGEMYRMVQDPRSRFKLKSFLHHWLETKDVDQVSKDQELFPEFDANVAVDLKTSLDLYLDEVIWSEKSDFRQLFQADYLYVNNRLAKFYGLEASETGFQKVSVDAEHRSGVLTHPYLMTGLAYDRTSSPIHRGVFVAKHLLGRQLRQPPENFAPLSEAFDPKMTTRERVEHQTKEIACMSCHTVINPLGFCLENYDAVGRYRTEEKQKPIQSNSVYVTPAGREVELNGARDLAQFLANDEMTQRSFVRQLFNYYSKQSVYAYGEDQLDRLHERFVENEFNVQSLLIDIASVVVNHRLE